MGKNNHFSGQPLYGQVIKLLDKSKILAYSRDNGGERYPKRFNCWIFYQSELIKQRLNTV